MKTITLYKYMTADHAKTSITKKRVKLSLLHDLNDPYEMVPCLVDALGAPLYAAEKVRSAVYDSIKNKHAIICMSTAIDQPLLWSHYADKHRGIVMAFNFPQNNSLIEVTYGLDRVIIKSGIDSEPGPVLSDKLQQLLAHKYEDWAYEKEYRFIVSVSPASMDDGHYWKELTTEYFSGVILGCLCADQEDDIQSLLATNGFPNALVSRVRMDDKQFKMRLPQGSGEYTPPSPAHRELRR